MKLDLMKIETVRKINELSERIEDIYKNKEEYTQSDYQGAIEAVIINAMQWERK